MHSQGDRISGGIVCESISTSYHALLFRTLYRQNDFHIQVALDTIHHRRPQEDRNLLGGLDFGTMIYSSKHLPTAVSVW